jgi:hypothetical protein
MELNDLRRHWQQPEQGNTALNAAQLRGMMAQQRGGLVDKMRRNALLEASLTVLLVVTIPFVPIRPSLGAPQSLIIAMRILLVLLMLIMAYYYYRKLRLLRQMVQPEVQVRAHLIALCTGLRQMLRFYYRLSLFVVPTVLALMVGFQFGRELAQRTTHHWGKLGLFAGALLLLGTFLQVLMIYTTRWYLQRLYGQHLDRLEGQLQELEEPMGPRSDTIS